MVKIDAGRYRPAGRGTEDGTLDTTDKPIALVDASPPRCSIVIVGYRGSAALPTPTDLHPRIRLDERVFDVITTTGCQGRSELIDSLPPRSSRKVGWPQSKTSTTSGAMASLFKELFSAPACRSQQSPRLVTDDPSARNGPRFCQVMTRTVPK